MRAFLLEVPESLLAERRRLGLDVFDEIWEGVLHMVPAPSRWHQTVGTKLIVALTPVAEAKGLQATYETNLYRTDDDYRIPDLVFALPSQCTARGVEGGAELVMEILSPGDESHEKLPFYALFGVREVLFVEPETRALEMFVLRGGRLHAALPDEHGRVRSPILGVAFATRPGPRLELSWPGGTATI
jgi:Uma2 family endonuclease